MEVTSRHTIGAYTILRKIGEGGMGCVYLGEHALLGRRAAIKVLHPSFSVDQNIVRRFFNEARAVTQIADPGIVQVFDFGYDDDGRAFIVMELLEGESMSHRQRRLGRFGAADAVRLVRMCCTSLAAAHARGVVHRDLKPDNVFIVGDPAVTGGERPKILDFGVAKLSGEAPDMHKTRTGTLIGTPLYMSPEQCRGAGDVDHRSDIYSIACVMFKLLTGHAPFSGAGSGDIIAAHLREPPPFAAAQVPELPDMIDLVLQRCLQKDPAARFQSMLELADVLGSVEQMLHHASQPTLAVARHVIGTSELPVPSPAPITLTPLPPTPATATLTGASGERRAVRPARRWPVILATAGVTLAVMVAVTIYARHHRTRAATSPVDAGAPPTANPASPIAPPPVKTGSPAKPGSPAVVDAAVPDAPIPRTPSVDAGILEPSAPRHPHPRPPPKRVVPAKHSDHAPSTEPPTDTDFDRGN